MLISCDVLKFFKLDKLDSNSIGRSSKKIRLHYVWRWFAALFLASNNYPSNKILGIIKEGLFFLLMLACSSSWHFYSSTRPPAFSISSTNHQNTGRYQGDGLINKLLLLSYRIFLSSNLTLKYLDSRHFIVRL